MLPRQPPGATPGGRFELRTERLGPLPLVHHIFERLGLPFLLDRFVPTRDRRCALPYAKALGVLLRSILVEREPIYRQHETVATFAPSAFGLEAAEVGHVGDDALGRALDRLFDADRGTLLTEVVVAAGQRFAVRFEELHNDSTTIRFSGQYRSARGRSIRGRRAPWITYGYSKDHRPDLKQLLFVLTTSEDGGIPVQFRCEAGNTPDVRTHRETWEALRQVAGRCDFLYVGDSKLCESETMKAIDGAGGRFVTVMPRSRWEDQYFREWIQTHEPDWELVWNRPNPRRRGGARDRWWVFRFPIPSAEAWPVTWVRSSLLALRRRQSRGERIAVAIEELERFDAVLGGPRAHRRSRAKVWRRVERILERLRVARYLSVELSSEAIHRFRQAAPGRPGPRTLYRRQTRKRWRLRWKIDPAVVAYDEKSDGMYPLLTNDRRLTPREVLEAHKRQPTIEKRFEQAKTVYEIAPVLLKNEGRVEALFLLYFLALLVQALLEREVRRGMERAGRQELALYPEDRASRRPTAQQILRLFSLQQRHLLLSEGRLMQVFEPALTEVQREVLDLLGIPNAYRLEATL